MTQTKKPAARKSQRASRKTTKTATLKIGTPMKVSADAKKPRLVAILFFDFANQTETQKLNLNGIFDRVFVDINEKKTVPFGVFVRTARTLDSPVQVAIVSPKNKLAGGFRFTVNSADLGGKKPELIQFVGNVSFATPVEGLYWFDVSYEGKPLGGCYLQVEFKDLKEFIKDGATRGDA